MSWIYIPHCKIMEQVILYCPNFMQTYHGTYGIMLISARRFSRLRLICWPRMVRRLFVEYGVYHDIQNADSLIRYLLWSTSYKIECAPIERRKEYLGIFNWRFVNFCISLADIELVLQPWGKWKQNENKISNQRSTFLDDRDSRLAGAEFLEVSADLYALVPFSDQQIGSKNQVRKYT